MKIIVKLKDEISDEFLVTSDVTSIGRSPDNDIVLSEDCVSRMHAEIAKEKDEYFVIDKGSGNGTCLNGELIQKKSLKDGDKIGIGDLILEIELETVDASEGSTLQEGMVAQLVWVENQKRYNLGNKDFVIGRKPECDIQLKEAAASGRHAVIKSKGKQYVIEDLGSLNGTKVNGQLSKSSVFKEGDTVEIENAHFLFEIVESKMALQPEGEAAEEEAIKGAQEVKTSGIKVPVIIGIIIAVAGIGFGIYFFAGGGKSTSPEIKDSKIKSEKTGKVATKEVPVSVTKAIKADLPFFLFETGEIQADDVHVSSFITEKLTKVNIENGQFVNKDDILLELDSFTLENKMAEVKAKLQEAESSYTIAKRNMDRNRRLYEKGVFPKVEFERAEDEFTRAEAITSQIKSSNDNLEKSLKDTKILAPISGAISGFMLEEGEIVPAGQILLRVINYENVYVNAKVPAKHMQKIGKGKKAYAEIDSFPDEEFEGTITSIDADVNKYDRTVNVKINMENPDLKLKSGMFVKLRIKVDEHKNVTVVPNEAIVSSGDEEFVFVVKGNKAYKKVVKTGYRSKEKVEIIDYDDLESQIVLVGQSKLEDGSIIRIIK